MKIKLLLIGLGLSACTSVLAQSPEAKQTKEQKTVVTVQEQAQEQAFLVNEEELEKALLQLSKQKQAQKVGQSNSQMQLLRYQMLINLLNNRKRVQAQPQQPVVININSNATTTKAEKQEKRQVKKALEKKDKTIELLNKRLAYLEARLKGLESRKAQIKAKAEKKKRRLIIIQKKEAEKRRLDSLEQRLQMLSLQNEKLEMDLAEPSVDTVRVVDTIRSVDTVKIVNELVNTKVLEVATDFRREVFFSLNSAKLTPKAKVLLDEAVRFMSTYPQARLLIKGSASVDGAKEANLRLARRRQASVRAYLEAQGITPSRFEEATPCIDTNVLTKPLARRVEIRLIK